VCVCVRVYVRERVSECVCVCACVCVCVCLGSYTVDLPGTLVAVALADHDPDLLAVSCIRDRGGGEEAGGGGTVLLVDIRRRCILRETPCTETVIRFFCGGVHKFFFGYTTPM
jgi:hypothetical protein